MNVKKWVTVVMLMVFLTGCGAEETFEMVSDSYVTPVSAEIKEIGVTLPLEAAAPAVESDSGRIYLCKDYEITVQTMEAGNLDATVRSISGYGADELTIMETAADGIKRYEFVWASAGETGDQVGRAVILDDGSHHYILSVLAEAAGAEKHTGTWQEMFRSFSVN